MATNNVKSTLFAFSLLITVVLSIERSRFKLNGRIIGGQDAIKGQFPYYVSLFDSSNSNRFCGGSIISEFHILSAAHCFHFPGERRPDLQDITASFGIVQKYEETAVTKIESISIHEKYVPKLFINDVALLKTVDKIEFSQFVQPIRMAESNFAAENSCEAIVCGLGVNKVTPWGESFNPKTLQHLNTQTLPQNECIQAFAKLSNQNQISWISIMTNLQHGNSICATNGFDGTPCHGDSGGPLVSNGVLVGTFSSMAGCTFGYPAIYNNVYAFRGWILTEMQKTMLDEGLQKNEK